jgi:chaperonin cofactor prefoldin
MDSSFHLIDIITVGSGLVAFLVQFAVLIWRISKAEAHINDRILAVEHDASLEMEVLRQEILTTKLEIGENFVRKEMLRDHFERMDARLDRLENKLDSILKKHGC